MRKEPKPKLFVNSGSSLSSGFVVGWSTINRVGEEVGTENMTLKKMKDFFGQLVKEFWRRERF